MAPSAVSQGTWGGKIDGVTGSVGKTTTKRILAACEARSCGSENRKEICITIKGFRDVALRPRKRNQGDVPGK